MWTLYLIVLFAGQPVLVEVEPHTNSKACAERVVFFNDLRTMGPLPILEEQQPVPLVGAFCTSNI